MVSGGVEGGRVSGGVEGVGWEEWGVVWIKLSLHNKMVKFRLQFTHVSCAAILHITLK